ncbi:MAG: ribonuclease III [Methanoregula sp. PtaU1.Bin051]|nr:MAG: ribonuclease III [Methanoregula sp. PtaU1.Bin051]
MNGQPGPKLSELLRMKSTDTGRVIDCFIRQFNTAHGNPSAERWDILKEEWQRYEFLGDRVLNLIVARTLFTRHNRLLDEGEMTKILSSVVSNQSLSAIAGRIDPVIFARLIPAEIGEQKTYGDRIIGGAFEAFVGALYCEAGFDDVACFVNAIMEEPLDHYDPQGNAVGLLQEYYQKQGKPLPEYDLIGRTGPDHRPVFAIRVTTPDGRTAEGTGLNIPDARQAAARAVLQDIGKGKS